MVKGGGPGAYNNGGTAILIGWPHDTMEMVPRDFLFFQRQYNKGLSDLRDGNIFGRALVTF